MAILQQLPYLGTAEEDVLFVEWRVAVGERVRAGQTIATVETLKAAFDVEAAADGVLLRQLCANGARVPLQAAIGVLGAAGEACDDAVVAALGGGSAQAAGPAPAPPAVAPRTVASLTLDGQVGLAQAVPPTVPAPVAPAARRRAFELQIDLGSVRGTGPGGMVRVVDVEAAQVVAPAAPATPLADGTVDPEFLAAIRRDPGFAQLGSELKLQLYRRHGALVGGDATLGVGAALLCERLVLGAGAYFGVGTVVEAASLHAGELLHFGARCRVRSRRIVCGDNAFFADDVEVGGGGAMDPEAELRVGSHGFVGEHVHLNPCRTLQIGDEVVVSRSACVMTHSFGPNTLLGYPSRFAAVRLGDGAQIGIGAVLFPGVEVGAGAVVLSGSSVVTSVPPGRLFGGVPAVDLKAAAQQLSAEQVAERASGLVVEFARQLELRGHRVAVASHCGATGVQVDAATGRHVLRFAAVAPVPDGPRATETVLVAVQFPDAEFLAVPDTTTAIGLAPPRVRGPLGPLAAAFREFLRKRGCRLHPRSWAYRGGWL